jgi:hypothetical protein
MDTNQVGRILTAHGAGAPFTKECGLGQGSVLAPLKWNLFLNPLLHSLQTTGAPYIPGDKNSPPLPITALAFADDLTIIAPSHHDYVLRMDLANRYLSFFGVEFNPSKTLYTYAHSHQHNTSYKVWCRSSNTYEHTSTLAPSEAIRYLGGWMSPTLNSRQAKAKLRHDIVRILNVLQHKTLEVQELTYILTAVLNAKALYYLNIVPLTDSDLAAFDRKIGALLRRAAGMARSSNIDVFHLPPNMWGYNVPTLVLTRRNLLIGQLHRITNAPDSILGQLARLRLRDYRDACMWSYLLPPSSKPPQPPL